MDRRIHSGARKPHDALPAQSSQPITGVHAATLVQRAQANPHLLTSSQVLYLQRTIGNAAVARLVRGAGSGQSPQPQPGGDGRLGTAPGIQRYAEGSDENQYTGSRAGGESGGEVESDLATAIQRTRGGGQPLAPEARNQMEEAFGRDFGDVHVHVDSQSDRLNRAIQARAFTNGKDIYFRNGEYKPGQSAGQKLIAHELTHVVQQTGGQMGGPSVGGSPIAQRTPAPSIQRKGGDGEEEGFGKTRKFWQGIEDRQRQRQEKGSQQKQRHGKGKSVGQQEQDDGGMFSRQEQDDWVTFSSTYRWRVEDEFDMPYWAHMAWDLVEHGRGTVDEQKEMSAKLMRYDKSDRETKALYQELKDCIYGRGLDIYKSKDFMEKWKERS